MCCRSDYAQKCRDMLGFRRRLFAIVMHVIRAAASPYRIMNPGHAAARLEFPDEMGAGFQARRTCCAFCVYHGSAAF